MDLLTCSIGVLGATGSVGRVLCRLLHEKGHQGPFYPLGSARSQGQFISYGNKNVAVEEASQFDFSKIKLLFSTVPEDVARTIIPRALKQNVCVVDKSSAFRNAPSIPLIVPEINGDLIHGCFSKKASLVSSPNCIVIPLCVTLGPLHKKGGLKRVVVSTYQSVSGAGHKGVEELYQQTKNSFFKQSLQKNHFSHEIAFNLIPQIGEIQKNGQSDEEQKIINETQKIMGPSFTLAVTCVRVPVFIGHSLCVHAQFYHPISVATAKNALEQAPGIQMGRGYQTPVDVVGEESVFVSRLRSDPSVENGLAFWVCCDNLLKGSALNAFQVAQKGFA